jgi:hypothetical protein
MTTPTKSAFLAAYEKEFSGSRLTAFHKKWMTETIGATEYPYCRHCVIRAWRSLGMTGEPTIEALRRLEP